MNIISGFAAIVLLCSLAVIVNVLLQLCFKKRNELPVVFHWFPVIGSTVTYGMDPFKFFFDCQAKASRRILDSAAISYMLTVLSSMVMSSLSFFLVGKSPSTLGPKAINSS